MTYPLSDSFCTKFNISKPFLPYFPGQQLTIVSYDPPEPSIGSWSRSILSPLPGSIGTTTVYLKIIEPVRLGDNHNAQIAKVQADRVIPHESNFPPALSVLQGSTIPIYYGSYSLELPAEGTVRSVRLILMEFVPGTSMQQLNPSDFSQLERQVIMNAVIDAESLVYTHNVRHSDIHPRNILVLSTATTTYDRRVVVVDFGKADVGRSPCPIDPEEEARYLPGVPISPLLRWNVAWWHHVQTYFRKWIDWDWQPWLEDNYGSIDTSSMGYMIKIWLPSFLTKRLPPPTAADEYSDGSDDFSE
ncbi:hypothetical protein V1519DRAFT_469957 [Lipomyces tetrasporus]